MKTTDLLNKSGKRSKSKTAELHMYKSGSNWRTNFKHIRKLTDLLIPETYSQVNKNLKTSRKIFISKLKMDLDS